MELRDFFVVVLSERFCSNKDLMGEEVDVFSIVCKRQQRIVLVCVLSSVQLSDTKECSPPGSSTCGILQASILGWVAISCSRGSF